MKIHSILSICVIALVPFVILAPEVGAFPEYGGVSNCESCHGGFRTSPYISLSDGQNWGNDLMDLHAGVLNNDCDVCHTSPGFSPVLIGSSDGGTGFEAIGCVGCHGRNEDMGCDVLSSGRGAGLRQHHNATGTGICLGCHIDADPANCPPAGENVHPSYYFTPDAAHPSKPTDPCNPAGEEQIAGAADGLDNDGDDVYDGNDADCRINKSPPPGMFMLLLSEP